MSDNIIDIDGISYFFVYEYYDNYEKLFIPELSEEVNCCRRALL